MLVVARSPVYEDPDPLWSWEIAENEVWAEADVRQMQVFRRLVHIERRPYKDANRREITWRLQIDLQEGPEASFKARGWEVPAHVWDEGERYFDDVWEILGGRLEPEPDADEHEDESDADPSASGLHDQDSAG